MLAVATSKPEHMAKRILEHFGLEGFFEVIGGATMDRVFPPILAQNKKLFNPYRLPRHGKRMLYK